MCFNCFNFQSKPGTSRTSLTDLKAKWGEAAATHTLIHSYTHRRSVRNVLSTFCLLSTSHGAVKEKSEMNCSIGLEDNGNEKWVVTFKKQINLYTCTRQFITALFPSLSLLEERMPHTLTPMATEIEANDTCVMNLLSFILFYKIETYKPVLMGRESVKVASSTLSSGPRTFYLKLPPPAQSF